LVGRCRTQRHASCAGLQSAVYPMPRVTASLTALPTEPFSVARSARPGADVRRAAPRHRTRTVADRMRPPTERPWRVWATGIRAPDSLFKGRSQLCEAWPIAVAPRSNGQRAGSCRTGRRARRGIPSAGFG